jgi:4'-phosphopantetheinyl transferase
VTLSTEPVLLPEDEVHLRVAALDAWDHSVDNGCAVLSPEEQATAKSYLFPEHQARYIAARVFLRTVLAAYVRSEPEAVRLARGPTGKPTLAGGSSAVDIRFNLSHSGGCVVCAVARGREVGVDVERLRPFRDPERIAERVLSPGELDVYRALSPERRGTALLRVWTCKEAYVKAAGEGITRPLREVEVILDPGRPAALVAVGGSREAAARWTMHETVPAPGFVCAVLVEGSPCRVAMLP